MASDENNRAAELQSARNQKASYEQQKRSYEDKIAANNHKLARLRAAKKTLGEIKDRLQDKAKAQKKNAENEDTYTDWTGEQKTVIQSIYAESVPSEYTIYINRVDFVLDSIVDAETALENENLEMYGIVGKLAGWINNLIGKIEKLCN